MPELSPRPSELMKVYQNLFESYGPQNWWPADSPFEVMIGAILTQNTNWKNVERAINNLKKMRTLSTQLIVDLEHEKLSELIRPSGYFNVKARRLKNYCLWFQANGGYEALKMASTDDLRDSLLSVNGIGPETADDILLYAFERPVFVIDAYTRRLFKTLRMIDGDEKYEKLRQWFEASLPADTGLFNEYHALIVRHAKEKCTSGPYCSHCAAEKI